MPVDLMPFFYVMAPIIFVTGAILILGPMLPLNKSWARYCLFGAVWIVVLRYLHWRLFDTVLAADGVWYELSWIWFFFCVELFAMFDAFILYLSFLRTTDRHAEADTHEARLRAQPKGSFPSLDIFITTYNEPKAVLEKTIVGALSVEYPNARVWVIDDGRRKWTKDLCEELGAGYIARPDNLGAKAGNINHALEHTNADFFSVFDADFVPQRNFFMRTMGFFEDPEIGIVQVPHAFYNHDPMQVNLALRKTLPDDQRFFFEAIMPSRDGWDAAFCCGSNSVTRRSAMREAGDALSTESVTEDMLLSLILLRRGYKTRYLSERLAFGLAPESIKAFFIQRQRWARGAIQIMFLRDGPLGRGLSLIHRLLFLPTHWLSQSMMMVLSLVAPVVFLLTGLPPLINVTMETSLHYLIPMVVALISGVTIFSQNRYFPLAAHVLGTFQSFKLLPTMLQTLVRPHGHLFQVTPKGNTSQEAEYEGTVFWISLTLIVATMAGMVINAIPEWRIVEQNALVPLVAGWCAINIVVLLLVCIMCLQMPVRRNEERFSIPEKIVIMGNDKPIAHESIQDISCSGLSFCLQDGDEKKFTVGENMLISINEVGTIAATIARVGNGIVGVKFDHQNSLERVLLIRKLFTSGLDTTAVTTSFWSASSSMLARLWSANMSYNAPTQAPVEKPVKEELLPRASLVMEPQAVYDMLNKAAADRSQLAA
jgi:cellulose synthase (UDP-forming)